MSRYIVAIAALVLGIIAVNGGSAKADPPKAPIINGKETEEDRRFRQRAEAVIPAPSETEVANIVTGVNVVYDEANPARLIVLDSSGKWVSSVREIKQEISLQHGSQNPTITCIMYEGTYKPTKPTIKVWQLMQAKTVSSKDFQEMVDNLQTNPEALRSIKK